MRESEKKNMAKNKLSHINTVVFSIVALLHLWRAVSGLELIIGSFMFPGWASYLGFIFAGGLAYFNYKGKI